MAKNPKTNAVREAERLRIPVRVIEYEADESDIIRYCVYVETNYDTDDDGKLDLVKALILKFYRSAGYNSSDKTAFIQWLE